MTLGPEWVAVGASDVVTARRARAWSRVRRSTSDANSAGKCHSGLTGGADHGKAALTSSHAYFSATRSARSEYDPMSVSMTARSMR